MFDRVLVLSASAGAGHVRAAQAVEKAWRQSGAAREVRHVDALEFTNTIFRTLYSKAYVDMASNAPGLFGWFYKQLDKPWKNEGSRLALDKLNAGRLVKLIESYRPDVVVCTHFLPAEIASWLKAKKRLACEPAVVVTDFDVHSMWLVHNYDRYFVARDEAKAYLEKLGITSDRITVSGIPIDPAFTEKKDKQAMREKHGLKANAITILVSAGGFGIARSGNMKSIIGALSDLNRPVQVIAAYGKSHQLKAEIERVAGAQSNGAVAVTPLGYTEQMDEYMAASDVLVGKPGGLTSSEALARGLAFVIVNPIPGQEERNSDHLLEQGVAIRANNISTLSFKLGRLLDDPERLARMQAAALKLARPRAAFDIVERLSRAPEK